MLYLEEITFNEDKLEFKNKILINPYFIVSVRQTGLHTTINMSDGQVLRFKDSFFSIQKMIKEFNCNPEYLEEKTP